MKYSFESLLFVQKAACVAVSAISTLEEPTFFCPFLDVGAIAYCQSTECVLNYAGMNRIAHARRSSTLHSHLLAKSHVKLRNRRIGSAGRKYGRRRARVVIFILHCPHAV